MLISFSFSIITEPCPRTLNETTLPLFSKCVVTSSLNQALEQRRHAVAVLETYVPRLVLAELNSDELDGGKPISREMIGVCAFVDMSGFSMLCDYLHHHTKNQHDVTASTGLEVCNMWKGFYFRKKTCIFSEQKSPNGVCRFESTLHS